MTDETKIPPHTSTRPSSAGFDSQGRKDGNGANRTGSDRHGSSGRGGGSDQNRRQGGGQYSQRRSSSFPQQQPYGSSSRFPAAKSGSSAATNSRTRQVVVERKVRRPFGSGDDAGTLDAEIYSLDSTISGGGSQGYSGGHSSKLTRGEHQARLEALENHKEATIKRQQLEIKLQEEKKQREIQEQIEHQKREEEKKRLQAAEQERAREEERIAQNSPPAAVKRDVASTPSASHGERSSAPRWRGASSSSSSSSSRSMASSASSSFRKPPQPFAA